MAEPTVIWASTAAPSGVHNLLLTVSQTPLWTDWNMRHIETHRAGHPVVKVAVFTRAVVQFAVALICTRPALVHLHAVDKRGSLFRNRTLARMSRFARVPVILDVHAVDAVEDVDWRRLDALYRELSGR